mgnify:FL=1
MRKKILLRGPLLTRSGYGEHARLVLRSLRSREDLFEVYIIPVNWGETGWTWEISEERKWIDERIKATALYSNSGGQFDASVQVTIPNEWEPLAPVNIGVTAGIEVNKVSPPWLEKSNIMDKIITISEHSRSGLVDTIYQGTHRETGQPLTLKCNSPVEVIGYPVKNYGSLKDLDLGLEYDFNFLAVAQHGPRKNLKNTIKWFIEENFDQEVGLVLKTFLKNGSINDRMHTEKFVDNVVAKYPDKKCKIYIIHGDMTDEEMHGLYVHPKIKCLVSLTHGEGYGLPIFEAAYSGLPIIAPGWSGQCDYLYAPYLGEEKKKKKNKKKRMHPYFAEVDFTIGNVPREAVWKGVIEKDTMWCYPQEGSFKMRLRQVRNYYENFKEDTIYEKYTNAINSCFEPTSDEDIDKLFNDIMSQSSEPE